MGRFWSKSSSRTGSHIGMSGNAVISAFFEILKIYFEAFDGTQFFLCVVEGREGGADAGSFTPGCWATRGRGQCTGTSPLDSCLVHGVHDFALWDIHTE